MNFLSSFKIIISSKNLRTICIFESTESIRFSRNLQENYRMVKGLCYYASIQTDLLFHQKSPSDQIRTFWKALSLRRFILQLSKRKKIKEGNKEEFLET